MTPAPDKFDFDKCHNAKRCKGCDDYYGRMKQENRELREALEKIAYDDTEPKQYRAHIIAKSALAKSGDRHESHSDPKL